MKAFDYVLNGDGTERVTMLAAVRCSQLRSNKHRKGLIRYRFMSVSFHGGWVAQMGKNRFHAFGEASRHTVNIAI